MNFILRYVCLALWAIAFTSPAYAQDTQAPSATDLVAVLQNTDATTFDKAKACQRLATIGNDDAVPALAALLGDEQLNAYARSALEAIGSVESHFALRDAVKGISGRPLAGVLLSIGNLHSSADVPLLVRFLDHEDREVSAAAVAALGKMGTPEASMALVKAFSKHTSNAPLLADACLTCADQLSKVTSAYCVASPDPAEEKQSAEEWAAKCHAAANDLYQSLIQGPAPKHIQLAAMLGQFRLLKDGQAKWLVAQLHKKDRDYFNLGLAASREAPGEEVTVVLVKQLPALEPDRRALLLRALGDRSDPVPVETLLAESRSDSPAVQGAAIAVLAKSDAAEAAAELVNVALGEGEAAQIAAQHLQSLENDAVDAAIAKRLIQPGRTQPVVIALIGQRRMADLKPQLIALLDSSDEAARRAAIRALGLVAELDDLGILLDRALSDAPEAETKAAQEAVRTAAMRMSDREACAARLVDRLSSSSPQQQEFLIIRLREVGGNHALAAVVAQAKSTDPALKDAATRELGNWPTADAADALLDLAKNDSEQKYRIRALRGYLRIARQLQLPDDKRIRFFHAAMETAERNEEKELALDVLARIPSPQTLELATPHLNEPALRDQAAETTLAIAAKLVTSDRGAVKTAMEKVIAAGVNEKLAERAREINQKAEGPGT